MQAYFVDSSALVKRYQREAGTEQVGDIFASSEVLIISRLAEVEVTSAIVRRAKSTGIPDADVRAALADFDKDIRTSFDVIELDLAIIRSAIGLTRLHGLRAADAIQLASARAAGQEVDVDRLILLSTDLELNRAAVAEKLAVLNPVTP